MSILEEERKATAGTEYLRDTELSAAARGVLATLLTLPQEQSITLEGLSKIFPNGKGAISSALSQLEERGYLQREMKHTESGRFAGGGYHFSGDPIFKRGRQNEHS